MKGLAPCQSYRPPAAEQQPYLLHIGRQRDGAITGVRLTKPDDTQYHVDLLHGECDCPDRQFRKRACKHLLGTRAALKAIGQL
jgi:hypothetical protein